MPVLQDIHTPLHFGPEASEHFVEAIEVAFLICMVTCLFLVVRSFLVARDAARRVQPDAPLAEGARFVAGTVELAMGEHLAVQVTITQEAFIRDTQIRDGKPVQHQWREIDRHFVLRPFYIRHASGTRVRVESLPDFVLVDRLDQREWLEPEKRRLRAELTVGEHVMIEGVLHKAPDPEAEKNAVGYRQAPPCGWMMRPAALDGLHLSTEAPERRHILRGRSLCVALGKIFLFALLANAALAGYWAREWIGQDVLAGYEKTRSKRTDSHVTHEVRVFYKDSYGIPYHEWLSIEVDDLVRLPRRSRRNPSPASMSMSASMDNRPLIAVRHVPALDGEQVASRATMLGAGNRAPIPGLGLAGLMLFLAARAIWKSMTYQRWYEASHSQPVVKGRPVATQERFRDDPAREP